MNKYSYFGLERAFNYIKNMWHGDIRITSMIKKVPQVSESNLKDRVMMRLYAMASVSKQQNAKKRVKCPDCKRLIMNKHMKTHVTKYHTVNIVSISIEAAHQCIRQ